MDWDLEELHRAALVIYPVPVHITLQTLTQQPDADQVEMTLVKGALEVYSERIDRFSAEWMAQAEKYVMLNTVDSLWQRHLTDLDVLREGIGLVGYGGRDPLVEYQRQSFGMWTDLQGEITAKIVLDIFRVAPREEQRVPTQLRLSNIRAGRGAMPGTAAQPSAPEPVRKVGMYDNVGRTDPCPGGSGKKFKHCHYHELQAQRQPIDPAVVKRTASARRRR
jgi:preprotein translocase subunit SecA